MARGHRPVFAVIDSKASSSMTVALWLFPQIEWVGTLVGVGVWRIKRTMAYRDLKNVVRRRCKVRLAWPIPR